VNNNNTTEAFEARDDDTEAQQMLGLVYIGESEEMFEDDIDEDNEEDYVKREYIFEDDDVNAPF